MDIPIETFNASDDKREFADVLLEAQQGPVAINKNGKPVAVLISAVQYAESQAMQEKQLRHDITLRIADIDTRRPAEGKDFLQGLKQKITDGQL